MVKYNLDVKYKKAVIEIAGTLRDIYHLLEEEYKKKYINNKTKYGDLKF
jgi:hypothetical protein